MKIKTKELVEILQAVKPGVANKEIIEQSNCFIIKDRAVYGFNDEIAVFHPVELDVEGAILAKEFYSFLSKVQDTEIDITDNKEALVVKGARFKSEIRKQEITLPLDEIAQPGEWHPLPETFKEGLEFALLAVSKDMANPVLTCVHWKDDYLQSCDNFRLTRYQLGAKFDVDILLSSSAMRELLKFDPVEVSFTDSWVHFKTDTGCVFSSRTFIGQFPDIDQLIETFDANTVIKFPSDTSDIVSRAEAIAEEDDLGDRYVTIQIHDKKLTVTAEGDIGSFSESTPIRSTADLEFKIKTSIIQAILKHYSRAHVDAEVSRLMFTTDNLIHLIALK